MSEEKVYHEVAVSNKFSFKGWKIIEFLKGNKEAIKIIVPAVISLLITQNLLAAGLGTIIGKGILDVVDYFTTEQLYIKDVK